MTLEESTRALEDAFVAVAFSDSHVPFARDLLFGGFGQDRFLTRGGDRMMDRVRADVQVHFDPSREPSRGAEAAFGVRIAMYF